MSYNITKKITDFSIKKDKILITTEIDDSCLESKTYKFVALDENYYVTLTEYNNKPYSIFINSKSLEHLEAVGAITTLVSLLFQNNAPYEKVTKALDKMISSGNKAYWGKTYEIPNKKRNYHSIYQEIAEIIRHFIKNLNENEINLSPRFEELPVYKEQEVEKVAEKAKQIENKLGTHNCLECEKEAKKLTAVLMDSCIVCLECSYSKCN